MVQICIFSAVGVLFLINFFMVRNEFKKCTVPVEATYVGVGQILGKSFGRTLLFTYDYGGKHFESVESMTSQNIFSFNKEKMDKKMQSLGYELGQKHTVYVNPNAPERLIADTKSFYRSWTVGFVILFVLIVIDLLDLR